MMSSLSGCRPPPAGRKVRKERQKPEPSTALHDLTETHMVDTSRDVNPGDQAAPGTPGAGEMICPDCSGTGTENGQPCNSCDGTGKVIQGVGGA